MSAISWQQLVGHVEQTIARIERPEQIVEHKEEILEKLGQYVARQEDFKDLVEFDEKEFTKNLVAEFGNGLCNIILMGWGPNQMSSIHSHNGSRCFVKVLQGSINEIRLACPSKEKPSVQVNLAEEQGQTLKANDVCYIDDQIGAHKVTNKSNEVPAISMHIYVPAYKTARVYVPQEAPSGRGIEINADRCNQVDLKFQHEQVVVGR